MSGPITIESPGLQTAKENNSLAPLDIHRVLVEAAEETDFDWPEFLSVERIKMGTAEISFGFLVLVGLIALGALFFLSSSFSYHP